MTLSELFDKYFDDDSDCDEENFLNSIVVYLKAGGDLNAVADNGLRLVDMAIGDGMVMVVKWLVENGVNLEEMDKEGWYPVLNAVDSDIDDSVQNGSELTFSMTRCLVSLGVNAEVKTPDGKTIRDIAKSYGKKVVEKFDNFFPQKKE